MVHNLSREVQMLASPGAASRVLPKRPAAWAFEKLDTLRHRIIQRAGRFTVPQGELTLTMSVNHAVSQDLLRFGTYQGGGLHYQASLEWDLALVPFQNQQRHLGRDKQSDPSCQG